MILGIDPGTEPALCIINNEEQVLSNVIIKKVENSFSFKHLKNFVDYFTEMGGERVYIEDVHSVFGMSASSNFAFGKSVGAIQQACCDLDVYLITPKIWQNNIWIDDDIVWEEYKDKNGKVKKKKDTKATSLNCARRLSDESFTTPRGRKPNHNLVDSYLIAVSGNRIKS